MDEQYPWTKSKPIPPSILKRKAKAAKNKRRRTPEQQKAVSDHMANMEANKPFQVTLRRGHNVNGTVYGPGTVTLPGPLARELSAREYHANQQEEVFRGERAAIIGGRTRQGSHRVTFVPVETFSESYGAAMPMDVVSGRGQADPGQGGKF